MRTLLDSVNKKYALRPSACNLIFQLSTIHQVPSREMTSQVHLTFHYSLQARDFELYTMLTAQSYPNQTATVMLPICLDPRNPRKHERDVIIRGPSRSTPILSHQKGSIGSRPIWTNISRHRLQNIGLPVCPSFPANVWTTGLTMGPNSRFVLRPSPRSRQCLLP